MIVPMKKVSLIVMDKDREAALTRIRDMGVMHLGTKTVSSPALDKLLARQSQLDTASVVLDAFTPAKKGNVPKTERIDEDLAMRVVALSKRHKTLQDYMFNHQREMNRFARWGEFDPKDFTYLANNGINAYLYELPLDSYEGTVGNARVITLATDKKNNTIRFLAFDKIANVSPYPMPDRALSIVEERNIFRKVELSKIEEELAALSAFKKELDVEKKSILAEIEFETAQAGMEQGKNLVKGGDLPVYWISGYVPAPDLGSLKRAASENSWALCAVDPEMDEEVPTKLKNGSFVKLIYPVTDFLEMIPGYRERDISIWFLLFFTLFFAMIFGDAAYGSILLLVSLIGMAKTAKKGIPLGFKFLFLMSVANVVWGSLVCSWFAFDTAKVPQILQNISLPLIVNPSSDPGWLSSYNANNFWIRSGLIAGYTESESLGKIIDANMMLFCFSIALLQIGIAHIVRIISNIRSVRFLADIGQLGILFGMYFVVLSMIVFNTGFGGVKLWQWYLVAGGFALVFVFGNYEGSILKSVLTSCANFITVLLTITNIFSDIMSYIRLWAVGLAAASIAGIINDFASPMFGSFVFFVFGLVFFAFGHGFNMVLNVLSVLVHGVRLNILEFSSHVGVSWSGFAYKPFAKR